MIQFISKFNVELILQSALQYMQLIVDNCLIWINYCISGVQQWHNQSEGLLNPLHNAFQLTKA